MVQKKIFSKKIIIIILIIILIVLVIFSIYNNNFKEPLRSCPRQLPTEPPQPPTQPPLPPPPPPPQSQAQAQPPPPPQSQAQAQPPPPPQSQAQAQPPVQEIKTPPPPIKVFDPTSINDFFNYYRSHSFMVIDSNGYMNFDSNGSPIPLKLNNYANPSSNYRTIINSMLNLNLDNNQRSLLNNISNNNAPDTLTRNTNLYFVDILYLLSITVSVYGNDSNNSNNLNLVKGCSQLIFGDNITSSNCSTYLNDFPNICNFNFINNFAF